MLKKVEIKNYRSIKDTALDLMPNLTVLVGPNGSGKTNLLSAITLLKRLSSSEVIRNSIMHYEEDDWVSTATIKPYFSSPKGMLNVKVDVDLVPGGGNIDEVRGANYSWYAKKITGSAKRLHIPFGFSDYRQSGLRFKPNRLIRQNLFGSRLSEFDELPREFWDEYGKVDRLISSITYYSASQFTNPSRCPPSIEVDQERPFRNRRTGARHLKFLQDLYNSQKSGLFERFVSTVGPDGLGLVDNIEFDQVVASSTEHEVNMGGRFKTIKRNKLLVIPKIRIGSDVLSPNQLSEGTFKTLALLFYILTDKSEILMIEEPEVCVHHGLLISIMEIIKSASKNKQIIVSTHSSILLDMVDVNEVRVVQRNNHDGTSARSLDKSLDTIEKKYLKEFLKTEGQLGEYWRESLFDEY